MRVTCDVGNRCFEIILARTTLDGHVHAPKLVNPLSAFAETVHKNPADTLGLVKKAAGGLLLTEISEYGKSASLATPNV